MKIRILKKSNPLAVYKLQRRFLFFWWVDCRHSGNYTFFSMDQLPQKLGTLEEARKIKPRLETPPKRNQDQWETVE